MPAAKTAVYRQRSDAKPVLPCLNERSHAYFADKRPWWQAAQKAQTLQVLAEYADRRTRRQRMRNPCPLQSLKNFFIKGSIGL